MGILILIFFLLLGQLWLLRSHMLLKKEVEKIYKAVSKSMQEMTYGKKVESHNPEIDEYTKNLIKDLKDK